ncbi:MAG: formate/nitrite transporter family protein [Oscillospiraceae bacterium]|nr:formate/nitrite transporter family protein [Oscillospiraceae bacterium]
MNQPSNMLTPQQIVSANIRAAQGKIAFSALLTILLGIFAGMFIACGASASSVAMHAIPNVGIARLVAGCIFPIGLMMIVFVGGELFTGDCLMIMGCMDKRFSLWNMIRVLAVVFFSNFLGSVVIAGFVSASGQFDYTSGLLGAFTIKVALGKTTMSFGSAFVSGILCNFFVCIAVLMATAAKDIAGKVLAIFFPIMAFVVSGYEHCVANMYYIPAGIFAANNGTYVQTAMETYGYTAAQLEQLSWSNFLMNNLVPVTLGNIVGGMVCVGLPLYLIHSATIREEEALAKLPQKAKKTA